MAVQARGLVLLGLLLVVALAHAAPGVVSVSGTTTFLISQSTTITVTLTPPPTVPTSIQITTTSRTIAYSSHQTLDFNPGQATLTFSLISPPNGRIGTATIVLTPADLLAYAETSFAVTVQGTIALSLVSTCSGVGLQTVIQATISPPAVGNVYLTALSNLAGASSAFFNNGQKTSQTTFLEPFRGPATVTFTNPFYATQTISYNVIGAFQTTLPALVTMTQTTFSITSTPSLAITRALITGNIPVLPSFIVFDQGAQLSFTTTTTFPAGTSSFTITAPGYCPLTASVFSEPDIVCPIGFAPSAADRVCLQCPGFGTALGVCSNRGTCTQSTCLGAADNRVTCKCVAGFSGEACQYINQGSVAFQTAILGSTPSPLQVSGSDFTLSVALPTSGFAGSASGENILVAPYGPLPFYGSSIATGVPFRGVATPIGFAVSVLCSGDNALLSTFPAVQITASFGADLTEREFTLTRLFYWDAPSQSWLPETRCTGSLSWTPFLETFTATVSVCNSGEYHVFIIDEDEVPPVPITEPKARPVELTTGQTGLQPQFPADPSFAVYEFLGEPLRLPIGSHDSASTVQPIVAFTVLCALFLALLS